MHSIIQAQASDQDLKFIQLKKYQISSKNENGFGSCLVVDRNRSIIFVCCLDEIIYVPVLNLMNFDVWTKEFLKTIETNINGRLSFKIKSDAQFDAHLLSISNKGYGTKLAVACNDQTKLFLFFYDLKSIYSNQAVFYNYFNFPILNNGKVSLRFASWHPEMNDNILACSLTDGSFYIVHVSDYPQKIITLLHHLSNNVSAFCWSPKGKQIVISFNNFVLSQYKFQLGDSKDMNSSFQESKRISLPENYHQFRIQNIHWMSTFNFLLICRNPDDTETSFLLMSIPSAKATGSDAVTKIVDFGRLIIETNETDDPFKSGLLSLENLIFAFTNRSSDFCLIGCNDQNALNVCENWFEIIIDDDYRLMFDDSSVTICGLSFISGISHQFKYSSIMKGGPNRPLAITYDSLGHLTMFQVDYENVENENLLKVPVAAKTLKPSADSLNSFAEKSTKTIENSFHSDVEKVIENSNSVTNFISAKSEQQVQQPVQQSLNPQFSISVNQPSQKQEQTFSAIKASNSTLNEAEESDNRTKDLFCEEIILNIDEFEKNLKSLKSSWNEVLHSSEIGDVKEQDKIRFETKFIDQMLNDISTSFEMMSNDVENLKISYLELDYLYQETKSLLDRNTDPKYRLILQKRNLNSIILRSLKKIASLKDYIEIQLRELNSKFDLEWHEWLQQHKKRSSALSSPLSSSFQNHHFSKRHSSPTSPFVSFIESPEKNQSNDLDFPENNPINIINRALNNNQTLIVNLKNILKTISNRLLEERDSYSLNGCNDILNLVETFKNASISNKSSIKIDLNPHQKLITFRCMTKERKNSLKNFLENRHTVPVRHCRPCSNAGDFNEKSSFISALEKIKNKKSILDCKKIAEKIERDGKTEVIEKSQNLTKNNRLSSSDSSSVESKITLSLSKFNSNSLSNQNLKISSSVTSDSKSVAQPEKSLQTFSFKSSPIHVETTVKLPSPKPISQTTKASTITSTSNQPTFNICSINDPKTQPSLETQNLWKFPASSVNNIEIIKQISNPLNSSTNQLSPSKEISQFKELNAPLASTSHEKLPNQKIPISKSFPEPVCTTAIVTAPISSILNTLPKFNVEKSEVEDSKVSQNIPRDDATSSLDFGSLNFSKKLDTPEPKFFLQTPENSTEKSDIVLNPIKTSISTPLNNTANISTTTNSIASQSQSLQTSTTASSSSFFTSLKSPSFPSFSTNLFESKTPSFSFGVKPASTTVESALQPNTSQVIASSSASITTAPQSIGSFSFSNAISALAANDSNNIAATAPASILQQPSLSFSSNTSSLFVPTTTPPSSSSSSSLFFSQPQKPFQNIFSTNSQAGSGFTGFSSFSFGNQTSKLATEPSTASSFFSQSNIKPSNQVPFSQQPSQSQPFSNPVFGAPASFGSSPIFGEKATFDRGFANISNDQSTQPFDTSKAFGGNLISNNDLSFNTFANQSTIGSDSAFNTMSFGGNSFLGSSGNGSFFSKIQPNNSDAFTQRRG
ncbi:Nuclear pore complex protein [Sarcoptes scabiei]|uniref:Nuclear pore complex protein n=1 Tax=Sarcoptes scabiei TaxID=52283 RepID=A0A834VA69_SARSC|nr:Nuclear pore complex protein [Sarcoptes scabiei]